MKIKNFFIIMFVLILSFSSLAFAEGSKEVQLTILGTSDTHSNLYGFSYENGTETKNNGLARISTYVNEVRNSNPNMILIDNGDTYQGTILADAVFNKMPNVMHPVSKVLNYMAYDAMVLGNHEFNFKIDFTKRIIDELKMPVLGANVVYADGSELTKPYTIVEKDGVKIGILGLTNPNAPRWDGEKVDGLIFSSVVETAKKYTKILLDDEKVDVLIVSAHVGMIPEFDEENGSDGAELLIKEIPEIDALLLGHYHTATAETIGDTLVGSPRNSGRDIVQFDLTVDEQDGKYVVTNKSVKTVDMETVTPDQNIRDLIAEEHQATIDFINGEGSSEDGMTGGGIFGKASADFQPVNEVKDIPEGKLKDTAVIDLIAKVQLEVSGADVTAVALFQDSSDIKMGDINYGDLFNIYKFDNTLYTVEVTGAELINYMEWSANHYNTWQHGDISISFDENVPGYLYDMFEGVEYEVNLSKPAGQRIENVMFKGEPLKLDQVLTLAVNNYRYSSGLKANKLIANNKNWESPMAIRDYLAQYIQEQKIVDPVVSNNWKITGVDLDHPLRDEIIALVNEEQIPVPYNKSLNIHELETAGFIVLGKVTSPVAIEEEQSKPEVPVIEPIENKTEEVLPITITYIIKEGDWLSRIAKVYNVNYKDIAKDNNIVNPDLIYPGQKLIIVLP